MSAARSALVWLTRYGLAGVALRTLARWGDPIARSAVAPPPTPDNAATLYDELLALGPVGGNRLVSASAHHAVVNEVLRHEAFRGEPGAAPTVWLNRLQAAALDPQALGVVDVPSLLAISGAQHARIRRLAAPAFTPRVIAGYAERIREVADDLLDRAGPRFDLIEDYAVRLPIQVIAEIMGLPPAVHDEVLHFGNELARTLDPALGWRDFRSAERAARAGNALLDEHIATLRAHPGDDLMSQLVQANQDGDRLTDRELRVNALLLIGAGFETTVNLIGNAVALLLEHPEQLAQLRADPAGWENAVEEVLRYDSPVQLTVRIANTAASIAGRTIPPGRGFVLLLGAANRDPAMFGDPHRFDVTRPEARQHLAFSAGAHYCLGAQLARLEARIALQVLFERCPNLALAGPAVRRETRVLRGYGHFPVAAPLPVRGG